MAILGHGSPKGPIPFYAPDPSTPGDILYTLRSPLITSAPLSSNRTALLSTALGCAAALLVTADPFGQSDWFNPTRRYQQVQDHIDPSETWLLQDSMYGAPGQVPSYDWTNPSRGPKRPVVDFIDPSEFWILKDTMYGTAGQVPDYDWPNPVRRKHQTVAPYVSTERIIEDAVFFPFSQDDWKNSTRPFQQVQDHIDPSETWLFAQLTSYPFSQTDWQNTPRRFQQVQDHIDPSETWLYAQLPYPFYFSDWQVPPRRFQQVQDHIDPSETWLLKDTFFGPAGMGPTYDWTNPSRGRYAPVLDHIDPAETWLLKDSIYGAPGQVPSYDWPNPRGPKPVVVDYIDPSETWLLKDTFFGPAGMGPTYDWSNPQRAKPRSEYGSTDFYKVLLFAAPPAPFNQENWTNPTGPRSLIGDQLGYIDASEFWMLKDLVPFNRADWPNPVYARPDLVRYAGHIETYKVNLYSLVFTPFYETDWPNPIRAQRPLTGDQSGWIFPSEFHILKDRFFGAVGQVPAFDWPNPVRSKPASVQYGYIETYKINLYQIVFVPFYQTDWQNPPRAQRPLIADQLGYIDPSEFQFLRDTLFGATGQVQAFDWSNPVRAKPAPVSYAGHNVAYQVNLFQVFLPFGPTDWPNPLRAKTINLDRLITSYNINALAPPFVQADWPNPRGTLRTPSHFTYYDFYKINLLNPLNAPSGRLRDWPNPSLGQPRNIGNLGWSARQQIIPGNFGLPDAGQLLLSTFTPMVTQDSAHHWRRIISLQGNMVITNNKTGSFAAGQSLLGNRTLKNDASGEVDNDEDLLGNIDPKRTLEGE